MIKKMTAAVAAAAICILSVTFVSGCKASAEYALNTDENGNKYYVVNCSGFKSNLKGEYEIPAYYGEGENRAPVTQIATEGFAGTGITKITIPNTVTSIGIMAFAYNYQLKEVVFEEGSTLEAISNGAFLSCYSLQSVTIPSSVKYIWHSAFENCENLASVTLSDNLVSIGNMAFQYCAALENIVFPQTLTTIGYQAFYFDTSLKSVIIPDSVRDTESVTVDGDGKENKTVIPAIGYGAFHNCTAMELAVVGAGVENILAGTFGYCLSLKELYLPAGLKKVEGPLYVNGDLYCGHAFHNNTSLEKLYFGGTAQQWAEVEIVKTPLTVSGSTSDNSALDRATIQFETVFGLLP